MKPFLSLFALCLFVMQVSGAILTVSNHPSQPAQYDDINAAIAAAASGDTIYIHGSPLPYSGNVIVNKQLTLIGPGKNPQKDIPTLATINGYFRFDTGSNGSQAIGLVASNFQDIGGTSNIAVIGCVAYLGISLGGTIGTSNWIVRDCIIRRDQGTVNPYALSMENSVNALIENNVIGGRVYKGSNTIFKNNLFIQNASGFGDVFTGFCGNNLLNNNIFYGVGPGGCTTCTFNNNITFGAGNNTLPSGSAGSGNLINQDPILVDAPLTVVNNEWRTFDVHLGAGSPGINAGTDGKDIGIYGGTSATLSGNANIPQIKSMDLDNTIVPAGGVIQIKVVATKPEGQ